MKILFSAGVVALVLVLTPALLCICRWTCPVHPDPQAAAPFKVERGANSVSGRIDRQQVETQTLLTGDIPNEDHGTEPAAPVTAITVGATRRFLLWRGFENSIGAHVTFHAVPNLLRVTHGERPVSFQVFLRVRLPAKMGRMWNMRMATAHRMSQ